LEIFLIGCGIGCLIGVSAAYLVVSQPRHRTPSWRELLNQQIDQRDRLEANLSKPPAITRLRSKDITWEIGNA
jgi:hypothetical protein